MTTLIQPWLIQCLKRKFLKSFLQLLELNCMAVQEKQLYLREESRPKIELCLNMLEWYLSFLLPTPQLQRLQQPNRPLLLILQSNEIGNSLIIRKYSCKTSLFTVKWWGNLCLLKNHKKEQLMLRSCPACWELQWKSNYLVSACTRIMYVKLLKSKVVHKLKI